MELHYRVRSVLLSHAASAVTLSPGTWYRDSATETVEVGGEILPAAEQSTPQDPEASFNEDGGKMTELRFDEETDLRPGELVTISVGRSRPGDG
jgi:hypothetical protein